MDGEEEDWIVLMGGDVAMSIQVGTRLDCFLQVPSPKPWVAVQESKLRALAEKEDGIREIPPK